MNEKFMRSLLIDFDTGTGLSSDREPVRRCLSHMEDIFADEEARAAMLARRNSLVYEYYDMGLPEDPSHIAFGTTIVYPGKVGDEYFMTKGHFHTVLETGEVYYCIRGRGIMLMENPEGKCEWREMIPGAAVYVPPRFAHRSINTSNSEALISFYAFRADAGHDYGTIETRGMRKLVVERDGHPQVIDNPKWQE